MSHAQERVEVSQLVGRWVWFGLHMLVMRGAADHLTTSRVRSLGSEELLAEVTIGRSYHLADTQS